MSGTDDVGSWFIRIPTDVVGNAFIMENASATDWRVLLAIAKHQGYKTYQTYPLYVAKTAEEARCSRRAALRSIAWWVSVGALIKTKRRRVNVYRIPRHFRVPPGISTSPRHNTPRGLNRDKSGRIVPSVGTGKVPAHGTIEVPAHGIPNQRSSSEVLLQNPPSAPHGGEQSIVGNLRPTPILIISPKSSKSSSRPLAGNGRSPTLGSAATRFPKRRLTKKTTIRRPPRGSLRTRYPNQ